MQVTCDHLPTQKSSHNGSRVNRWLFYHITACEQFLQDICFLHEALCMKPKYVMVNTAHLISWLHGFRDFFNGSTIIYFEACLTLFYSGYNKRSWSDCADVPLVFACSYTGFLVTKHIMHQSFVLLDFSLTVKAATLIFISGRGSAISSAKEGKSGFIYNVVKS